MYIKTKLASAVKASLLLGAACTTLATVQVSAQENQNDEAAIEKIAVTGSRIKSAELASASPLQIIDAGDIQASGVANIQDLLLENPAFGTPAISRTNSNFQTASAGVSTIDLRDLGTARTLVLVNGRRYVSGVPGSSAVDLNTIPTQFIERVEILTGGASAVYGSDAVAGVVNIVMKDEFDGLEFQSQYGESKEGDAQERQFSLTTGSQSSDGRSSIMAHLSYTDQGAVFSRDRARSAVDQISGIYDESDRFQADENPNKVFDVDTIFDAVGPFFSSFPPQGRFSVGDTIYTFNQNGELQEGFSTNGNGTIGPDGFNRSNYRTIAIPTERYMMALNGKYELNDNHRMFFEGTYSNSSTTSELEPFPFSSDDIYADGLVPLEFLVDGQMVANPFVPEAILNSAVDENGDGARDVFFAKRLQDIGNRGNTAERDTFRILVGMDGELFDGWYYDAFYAYGQTKEAQVSRGLVNVQNFRYALESITDVNDLDGDGITDEAVCLDDTARSFGCVPIDIYGFNSISPEAAAYVTAPALLSTEVTQEIIGANLAGELFDLPAGPLGVAFGFEYREEFSRSEFDALQQAGLNGGNAIPETSGEFDVTEFYVETNVPVFDGFNVKAAIRASDYSTVGSTTSWNVGFDYAVNDQLRFRVIQAQSTRAPNIDELFQPDSQTFPSGLIDPCVSNTSARCLADPGVAANVAANGTFTLTQSDIQGISGFDRGNPNLKEEVGKSTTVGVVYTPDNIAVLEDFSFTLDYFDIEIEDAIVPTPRQFILDQCYGGGDESFCDFVTRRSDAIGLNSAGSIEFIDSGASNSGGATLEGVDLTATYGADLLGGHINARLAYTYLIDGETVPLPGADVDPFVGEIGTSEHKAFFNLGYRYDDFNIVTRLTYIGAADFDDQFLSSFGLEAGAVGISSVTYVDLQASYQLTDIVEVYGGVDNLFDKEPPRILTGVAGNDTGTETNAGTYDPIGQEFYVGVRARF